MQELEKIGLQCIPTNTNFIYLSLTDYKKDYFALLKQDNIKESRVYEKKSNGPELILKPCKKWNFI